MLACEDGHRFDVARQGHVVLVPGGSRLRADTVEMVAARVRVHASGAFDGLRTAVVQACRGGGGLLLDVGAGPGTWAAAVLDALPASRGVALELSVPALRTAARAHERLAAVGADLTRPLPLVDGAVGEEGVVLAVFAPLPSAEELRRVTAPGALLVVVTPTTAHLASLRAALDLLDVPAGKAERLSGRLGDGWEELDRRDTAGPVRMSRDLAADVVAMGPNAWHAGDRVRLALAALPSEVDDTVAVTVSTFRRRDAR